MFEVLFKYPMERYAQGSLELAVTTPVWMGLIATLALGIWWGLRYAALPRGARRWTVGALRLGLLAALLTLLLDPQLVTPSRSEDGSQLIFAIDASASMAPTGNSEARVADISKLLSPTSGEPGVELAQRFDTRFAAVGTKATLLPTPERLQLTQGQADWAGALSELSAQHPALSHMVLVSDGQLAVDEALERTLLQLRARGIRVHTIRTPVLKESGRQGGQYFSAPTSRLGDEIVAAVRLGYTNSEGQKAEVRIEDDGLLIERQEVSIPAGTGAFDVNFTTPLQRSGYRHMQSSAGYRRCR